MSQYNLRNPGVKRLMREAEELREPTIEYHAQPLEDNLFEWHFTLSGPPNTDFDGGVYHGRITLPTDYPMKPPSIILLTPNGRFETNKKICLSISGYHPESWQPSWSIRTALLALIGFLPTHGNGAIGSLDYTPEERRDLALKSQSWECPQCGLAKHYLADKETETHSINLQTPTELIESKKEEKPSSQTEPPELIDPVKLKGECVKHNDQSIATELSRDNDVTADTTPSISSSNEFILRHRTVNPIRQYNETTDEADTGRPVFRNWSIVVIWVIIILLGILILRRLLYF